MTSMTSMASNTPNTHLTIDNFYENQKKMYDICGNVINKDKYPFVDILSTYLNDIVISIDVEIKNSARNSMINWREKKNPKLLSRFINNDDNVNLINRSMNKITATNYSSIIAEITTTLLQDNMRKLPDYCKYIFDSVIKKCLNEENFTKDYIQFLFGFNDNIAKYISQYIAQFIKETHQLANTNENLKDLVYFGYIKDVASYKNIGFIYGQIYLLLSVSNTPNVKAHYNIDIDDSVISNTITQSFNIINNFLDWLPVSIDELNSRLYFMIGMMETICTTVWNILSDKQQNCIKDVLNLAYNMNNIHNKIKFKILDLQDIIKNIKPITKTITKPITKQEEPEEPKENITENKINQLPITAPTTAPTTATSEIPFGNTILDNTSQPIIQRSNPWTNMNKSKTVVNNLMETPNQQSQQSQQPIEQNYGNTRNDTNQYRKNNKSGNRDSSNRDSNSNSKQYIQRKEDKKDDIIIRRNMFSGLDINDSGDNNSNPDIDNNSHTINDEDDGFIKIERKSRNTSNASIYKPKKTMEIAIEGSKIYSGKSSNRRK